MNELKRKAKARLILSAALIAIAALCLVGVTLARQNLASKTESAALKYSFSANAVHILKAGAGDAPVENGGVYEAPGGWTSVSADKTEYSVSFLLSNSASQGGEADYDQTCVIEVFVTDGAYDASLTVTLASGGLEITGTGEQVAADSPLYEAYGAGRVYKFINGAGETYTWKLLGGSECFIPMTLEASGDAVDPAALTVIATGIPTDNN